MGGDKIEYMSIMESRSSGVGAANLINVAQLSLACRRSLHSGVSEEAISCYPSPTHYPTFCQPRLEMAQFPKAARAPVAPRFFLFFTFTEEF